MPPFTTYAATCATYHATYAATYEYATCATSLFMKNNKTGPPFATLDAAVGGGRMPRLVVASFVLTLALALAIEVALGSVCTVPPCTNAGGRVADPCDVNTDYFPTKIESDYSLGFEVTYANTYKVVTFASTFSSATYVYVQAGCAGTVPASVTAGATEVLEVPLTSVSLGLTTHEAYVEIIGEVDTIKAQNGDYSSSACINKRVAEGDLVDLNTVCPPGIEAHFGPSTSQGYCCNVSSCVAQIPAIQVGEVSEIELLPQLEWLEYFSLAFNQEGQVAEYLSNTEADMSCLTSTIALHTAARRRENLLPPVVLWATPNYNAVDGSWSSIGTCPNYYCDLIARAGGNLINERPNIVAAANRISYSSGSAGTNGNVPVNAGGIVGTTVTATRAVTSSDFVVGDIVEIYDTSCFCGTNREVVAISGTNITLDQPATCVGSAFGACWIRKAVLGSEIFAGVEVDFVFMAADFSSRASDCNAVLTAAIPDGNPAKTQRQAYDYGATVSPTGGLDWFGSRLAEPDVLIEEVASILFPDLNLRPEDDPIWWKNAFEEGCNPAPRLNRTDLSASCAGALVTRRASTCAPQSSPSSSGLTDGQRAALGVGIALGTLALLAAVVFGVVSWNRARKMSKLLDEFGIHDALLGSDGTSIANSSLSNEASY